MIGVKTSDNVYFLGDALFSAETINKYHIFFIYDVREFLNTLSILETLDGDAYICSHVEILSDIKDLIKINRDKVYEIIDNVYNLCNNTTFEDILKSIFDMYKIDINTNQYILIGSTIKSYLSYLYDEDGSVVHGLGNYGLYSNNKSIEDDNFDIRKIILYDENKISYSFKDNKMIWNKI